VGCLAEAPVSKNQCRRRKSRVPDEFTQQLASGDRRPYVKQSELTCASSPSDEEPGANNAVEGSVVILWKCFVAEIPGPEEAFERAELREILHRIVDGLPSQEARVIRAYYFEEEGLACLARVSNCTKFKLSRIHSRAKARLARRIIRFCGARWQTPNVAARFDCDRMRIPDPTTRPNDGTKKMSLICRFVATHWEPQCSSGRADKLSLIVDFAQHSKCHSGARYSKCITTKWNDSCRFYATFGCPFATTLAKKNDWHSRFSATFRFTRMHKSLLTFRTPRLRSTYIRGGGDAV